jgi:hypothetical protein
VGEVIKYIPSKHEFKALNLICSWSKNAPTFRFKLSPYLTPLTLKASRTN